MKPPPHPHPPATPDHPRKAKSYAYQSSPYTIDAIDEEGRNRDTTDWRFFYDAADCLIEAHGGFLQDFTFDHDQADNLRRMARPDGTTIMRPDQTNAIRELIRRRGGLGEHQRLRPDYDKNGNLTDDGEHHYSWDGYNHLTGIDYHGHPRWHTTLTYDGLDHLVTITERDGKDRETRHLLWCGEAICAITDDQGQLITRVFDQGEWQQGKVLYYTKDHLGSIRDVLGTLPPLDELINLASYDYGPYGERLDGGRGRRAGGGLGMGSGAGSGASSLPAEQGVGGGDGPGSEAAGPDGSASPEAQDKRHGAIQATLGYAGMFHHARSGLYLTHYRAYDPRLGRWLSREPLGDGWDLHAYLSSNAMTFDGTIPMDAIEPDGGQNAYLYANANPLWFVDSTGLNPALACLAGLEFGPIGCGVGAIAGGTLAILALTIIPGDTAQQCKDPGSDCTKASKYQLLQAGIVDPHGFKSEYVGNNYGRFDICICKDGSIKLAAVGQCGRAGSKIDTYRRWK